jgi:hypothetical protein
MCACTFVLTRGGSPTGPRLCVPICESSFEVHCWPPLSNRRPSSSIYSSLAARPPLQATHACTLWSGTTLRFRPSYFYYISSLQELALFFVVENEHDRARSDVLLSLLALYKCFTGPKRYFCREGLHSFLEDWKNLPHLKTSRFLVTALSRPSRPIYGQSSTEACKPAAIG